MNNSKKYQIQYEQDNIWPIGNILNEICHGLHIENFQKTISAPKECVHHLLKKISQFYLQVEESLNLSDLEFLIKYETEERPSHLLELSEFEFSILQNSFAEVSKQIEDWEFQTRVGVKSQEIEKILESFTKIDE